MEACTFSFRERIITRLLKLIYLIFFIPFSFSAAQSQEIQFINLTVKNGLSHNTANCIYQDKQGFIWIGTMEGLNRFDGNDFTIYRNDPHDSTTINDNSIHAIFEDESGYLWIGTEKGGLNRFNPRTSVFTHFLYNDKNNSTISNNNVNYIVNDRNNNLWICTNGGLNLLKNSEKHKDSPKFTRFVHSDNDPNSISNNSIFSILFDKQGKLWLSLYQGFGVDIIKFTDKNYSSF